MAEIDIESAARALADGAQLVDVREPSEFRQGHVPGAVNLPMSSLTRHLGELDRDRPVLVVCGSGNRSRAMVDVLAAAGFDAVDVLGGTSAWVRAGHPTEK